MNSLNFPDTNVWLALVWGRHSHADLARSWFEQAADEQFFFCRFTQLALLRLLTTEAVLGRDVLTMTSAWDVYDQCCADERIAFLTEPEALDPGLRSSAPAAARRQNSGRTPIWQPSPTPPG